MEHAKKMLLIEPRLIEKLNQHKNDDNPTSRLDTEMKDILDSDMDDRKKCILYLQILQRYLHFNEEQRQPLELPIISKNMESESNIKGETVSEIPVPNLTFTEKEKLKDSTPKNRISLYTPTQILKFIPKSYVKKGESLLDHISTNNDKIRWDPDNGSVFVDNQNISGSNIVDLINDLLRPLKRKDPIGWEAFAEALNDIKVPQTFLGNPTRIDFINNLKLNRLSDLSKDTDSLSHLKKRVKKFHKNIDWERWTPY